MSEALSIMFVGFSLCVAYKYFSYALIDHRYPDTSPSLFAKMLGSVTTVGFGVASVNAITLNPEIAPSLSLVVIGVATLPAIAPPLRNEYKFIREFPKWFEVFVKDKFGAFMMQKIIAILATGISIIVVPEIWYYIVPGMAAWLLFVKGGALAFEESGNINVVPREILKKWTIRSLLAGVGLVFICLWPSFIVFNEVQYEPQTWSVYAGIGIGSLIISVSQ